MPLPRRAACLLIHGFGGSPFEMEPLVPALERLGCAVDLTALPGHEGDIGVFRKTLYPDWLAHAETRFLNLRDTHDAVFLIGFSMGAAIALSLAARHAALPALAGTVALAPPWRIYRFLPFRLKTAWLPLTPLIARFKREIALPAPHPESRAIAPFAGYEGSMHLPQLHSLARGVAAMRKDLPGLTCPLLLLCDARDSVCPPDGALRIARACSSADVTLRLTRMRENVTSHHMLTTHRETRETAARHVADFIAARLRARFPPVP